MLWIATISAQLPPGSRVHHATGVDAGWTPSEHLTALVFDAIQQLTWVQIAKSTEKGKQPKQPKPLPRPSDARAEQDQADRNRARMDAFIAFRAARAAGRVAWPKHTPVNRTSL